RMPPYEKSMEITPFKQRKCLATRKDEVCTIRSKFPNKLPVIVERYLREKKLPLLDKTKFLVPHELTFGQFLSLLRSLEASQALYLLISGKNMSYLSASMGEVYSQFRDPDGFLYITYASQDIANNTVIMYSASNPVGKSSINQFSYFN
uniref:Microtubule-associated proteins 1A/1B light chain 3C-like n=1 Tax=Sinocyclocheilus rhinocerous TaxID=307959 RepID=A0A673H3D4_9TELE